MTDKTKHKKRWDNLRQQAAELVFQAEKYFNSQDFYDHSEKIALENFIYDIEKAMGIAGRQIIALRDHHEIRF